jgi:hypothetical protein
MYLNKWVKERIYKVNNSNNKANKSQLNLKVEQKETTIII